MNKREQKKCKHFWIPIKLFAMEYEQYILFSCSHCLKIKEVEYEDSIK